LFANGFNPCQKYRAGVSLIPSNSHDSVKWRIVMAIVARILSVLGINTYGVNFMQMIENRDSIAFHRFLNNHRGIARKNEVDGVPMSLLHFVAQLGGTAEMAKELIARDADVNLRDSDGKTPLDLAVAKSNHAVAHMLRRHGGSMSGEQQTKSPGQREDET